MGVDDPVLLSPVNAFFAGDKSSCFIGLPLNMLFAAAPPGGDLGAPNRGLEAAARGPALVGFSPPAEVLPKEKVGFEEASVVAGAASVFAAVALLPKVAGPLPKRGADGVEAPLPNALLGAGAGLAPNNEDAVPALPSAEDEFWPPNNGDALGASNAADFAGSAGFAPNRLDACVAGAGEKVAPLVLFDKPNTFGVADVSGFESALVVEPNMLKLGLGASFSLGASVEAGLGWNREDPKLGCAVGALGSNRACLVGCDSFSLSDSPPSLPPSSALVPTEDSFADGGSCLAAPKRLEVVVVFGAKMELAGVDAEFPNIEPFWVAATDGANFIGVVLGFHV